VTEPYSTVRIPGDGVTLTADVSGPPDGRPVLLLHGGGQTRHSWHHTATTLGADGYRVYNLDLRGHGESDWAPDGNYHIEAFAADVRAVAESMTAADPQHRLVVFVGASLGGIASMTAIAETQTDFAAALVLVDVGPKIERQGADRIGAFMMKNMETGFASLDEVADAIGEYNPHRPRPSNLDGLKKNLRQKADGRWYWHWDPAFITGRRGSSDETRSLTEPHRLAANATKIAERRLPTLMVRGRQSDLLSEEGAAEYKRLIPHGQFVDVAGAGHMVAGDRNDVFNDAVVKFLEAL
jgi:pimeloyl-ACP methyl ester carboxylesterase